MKQTLLEIMVAMMPFMMPIVWIGYASVAIGALLLIGGLLAPRLTRTRPSARLAGGTAAGVGLFFVACQIAGAVLGAQPAINFGDSSRFEFNLVPFWQIGGAFIVGGLLIAYIAGRGRPQSA